MRAKILVGKLQVGETPTLYDYVAGVLVEGVCTVSQSTRVESYSEAARMFLEGVPAVCAWFTCDLGVSEFDIYDGRAFIGEERGEARAFACLPLGSVEIEKMSKEIAMRIKPLLRV